MGILEKNESVSLFEFASIVDEISDTLKEFGREGKELAEKKNSNIKVRCYKVKELFAMQRGSGKYTKRYISTNKGEYPVFSGNTSDAFAHINTFDYAMPCLSWAIDGFAGFMMMHNDKFSATNHRGILVSKYPDLNLYYAKEKLEPLFRMNKKGRYGLDGSDEYTTLPPYLIENIEIPIPIDMEGNFDVFVQSEAAQKYEFFNDIKKKIVDHKKRIESLHIEIQENSCDYQKISVFKLHDLFYIEKGFAKYTRKYGNLNKGEYPVFSASNNRPLAFIDTFDYHGEYLTWATNGFAGYVKIICGKFSINGDRGILKAKHDNISLMYIKYKLEPIMRNIAKGRKGENGEDEFTKVYPSMIADINISMPVDKNGNFDLTSQMEIAEKYLSIEQIKRNVIEELNRTKDITINIV